MRAAKRASRGRGEGEGGRRKGHSREKGMISVRELPTGAVAAQLFIWKLFERGLAGFFRCAMDLMRGSCGGLSWGTLYL